MEALAKKALEQQRADAALHVVGEWANNDCKIKIAQRIKELPLMVRNNGLGQALAVLMKESKKQEESRELLMRLSTWLLKDSPVKAYPSLSDDNKPITLLQACFEGTRAQYLLAQQEAIAYLGWLKLFAEAIIETESQNEHGT